MNVPDTAKLRNFLRPVVWALFAPTIGLLAFRLANGHFGSKHETTLDLILLIVCGTLLVLLSRRPLHHDLAQHNAWTEALFASIDEAIVTVDPEHRIAGFSPRAEQMFGMSAREALGMPLDRIYPLAATVGHQELTLRRSGGGHFQAAVRITSFHHGSNEHLVLAIADRATWQLREEELLQWRQIFAQTRMGIVIGKLRSKLLEQFNPQLPRMFGYGREELLTQPIYRLFASSARDALEQQLAEALRDGHVSFESIGVRKDGSEFSCRVDVDVVKDPEGAPLLRVMGVHDISTRKAIEDNLRNSEQLLRLLTESQRDLITRWRPDTTLEFVNGAMADLCGCPASELIGRSWLELLPVDVRGEVETAIRGLRTAPARLEHEHPMLDAQGRQRWFRWINLPLYDQDGKLLAFQGIGQDISELYRTREQLSTREEEIRILFDGSQQALLLLDAHGRIRRSNRQAQSWLELTESQPEQRLIDIPTLLPIADVLAPALERALHDHSASSFEITLAQGSQRHFRCTLHPVTATRSHRSATVLFAAQDVSECHQAIRRCNDLDARLDAIARSVPGFVYEFELRQGNPRTTFIGGNIAALLGTSAEAILSDRNQITDNIHPDDQNSFRHSVSQSIIERREWNWTGRISNDSTQQAPRWIAMRAVPRLSDRRHVWDGIALDISELKEKELALAESRQALRELSAHRETVREEERTHIAREIHDELGQNLSALRMGLSVLAVQASADTELSRELMQLKTTVDSSIKQVRNITTALRPTALDMGLPAALRWLASEFQSRHGIACHLDAGDLTPELDDLVATGLFRIVQESLTNISRHAEAEHVWIMIRHIGNFLVLEIRDDGCGFSPAAPGQRKGFGLLGMHERALMMNGTVNIHSTPGRGTVIAVSIPLA